MAAAGAEAAAAAPNPNPNPAGACPNFAVVCSFLERYGPLLDLPDLPFPELERALQAQATPPDAGPAEGECAGRARPAGLAIGAASRLPHNLRLGDRPPAEEEQEQGPPGCVQGAL